MFITHIVAMGSDGVIGLNNKLPWNLPEDLKHFKEITLGKTVVMGSNTFKSIVEYSANKDNILPGRKIIVISSSPSNAQKLLDEFGELSNVEYWTKSIFDYYIKQTKNTEHLIIGGTKLFSAYKPNKIIATIIDKKTPEGDSYYPYDLSSYNKEKEEEHVSITGIKYSFNTFIL